RPEKAAQTKASPPSLRRGSPSRAVLRTVAKPNSSLRSDHLHRGGVARGGLRSGAFECFLELVDTERLVKDETEPFLAGLDDGVRRVVAERGHEDGPGLGLRLPQALVDLEPVHVRQADVGQDGVVAAE